MSDGPGSTGIPNDCDRCVYFVSASLPMDVPFDSRTPRPRHGKCHRFPPTGRAMSVAGTNEGDRFPDVVVSDWCGEFLGEWPA